MARARALRDFLGVGMGWMLVQRNAANEGEDAGDERERVYACVASVTVRTERKFEGKSWELYSWLCLASFLFLSFGCVCFLLRTRTDFPGSLGIECFWLKSDEMDGQGERADAEEVVTPSFRLDRLTGVLDTLPGLPYPT